MQGPSENGATRPVHLLLIDNDAKDRFSVATLLHSLGQYEVKEAASLAEGLTALASGAFDVCLTGSQPGVDFVAEAAARRIETPVILLLGVGDPPIDRSALEHRAADFLLKGDLTAANLDRTIRYSIQQARAGREIRESHELLHSTFDSLTTMIAVVRLDGTIIAVNRAWHQALHSAEVAPGRHEVSANYLDAVDRAAAAGHKQARLLQMEFAPFWPGLPPCTPRNTGAIPQRTGAGSQRG